MLGVAPQPGPGFRLRLIFLGKVFEIEMREFAKKFNRRLIIGTSSLVFTYKRTKIQADTFSPNHSLPSIAMLLNAFIPRRVYAFFSSVSLVKGLVAWAKVRFSVIERVSVFMVSRFAFIARQFSVHQYCATLFVSHCVKATRASEDRPVPLSQPVVVRRIDDGVLSFGKWNKFDRLIERLDDFVSANTTFLHVLTSNKDLRHSAAFVL